ncbi:MAG: hypothetical protein FWD94_04055 [Treponema sp.]|nr:hypothetical protein [Treponema sp.]
MKLAGRLVPLALLLAVPAVALPVFFSRAPVLVVTDVPFAALYGEERIRGHRISASLSLFRPVRPVMIADDASPDILIAAISHASGNPFAVLFPRRFSAVAERFHEEFPPVPAVVFRGTSASGMPAGNGTLSVYGTDRRADLFRAGILAGTIGLAGKTSGGEEDSGGRRTHVLLHDSLSTGEERAVFSGAVMEVDSASAVVFAGSSAAMPDLRLAASVVSAGGPGDFMERNVGVPVILFSWMHPDFTSGEVLVMFDDSHWALAAEAARMAARGEAEGLIPSKTLIFSERIADNGVARVLKRAAGRIPPKFDAGEH